VRVGTAYSITSSARAHQMAGQRTAGASSLDHLVAFSLRWDFAEIESQGCHEIFADWFDEFARPHGSFHQDLCLPVRVEGDHRTAAGIIAEVKAELPDAFSNLLPSSFLANTGGARIVATQSR
jgi:hypothetical protein